MTGRKSEKVHYLTDEQRTTRDARILKTYDQLISAGEGRDAQKFTAQRFGLSVATVGKIIRKREENANGS